MLALKEYTAKTHQGPYLEVNEDYYHLDVVNNLFLIFDGFGGAGVGDSTVTFLSDEVAKFYTKLGCDPDLTLPFFFSPKYLIEGNALINSIQYAHQILMKRNNQKKNLSQKGGASIIGAAMSENIMTFACAGNCASYLYRSGHIGSITHPDVLQFHFEGRQNTISHLCPSNGLGLFDDLHLQIRELKVEPEDIIIFVTDGVFGKLDINELKYIIEMKNDDHEKGALIFNLANNKGNLDNQTFMMLRF